MNAVTETKAPLRADRFRRWWDAGFADLVPIIPPGAHLTANTRVDPASRGKCPGQRTPAGQWRGFSGWEDYEASAPDLDLWGRWGAGVGLRGSGFPGIDIDITDVELADIIEKIAENVLGPAPTRIGLAPKSLRPYRLGEGQDPMPGRTLTATGPDGTRHLLEMRGDRQQYVVEGIHASTGQPYTWDTCPARPGGGAALTPITAELVDAFFAEARSALETLGYEVKEGRASAVPADDRLPIGDPAHLAPSIEAAVEALNAIPCADITDRAEWHRLCCAFKAAVGGDEAAFGPLVEWCSADPRNSPEYVRYHCWDSVSDAKGGWDALCREAEWHGYSGAAHDFEAVTEDDPASIPGAANDKPGGRKRRFPLIGFDDIRIPTGRNYVVKGLIPKDGLAIVWGPPKCGKSFLVSDLAMHVARGTDYRGHRVQGGPVAYVACEGAGGFHTRIEALRQQHLDGARDTGTPFYLVPRGLDLIKEHGTLIADIRDQLNGTPPALVVIDTLNRSLVGSESSDEDMGAYVKAADKIKEVFGCAVIVVHHCGVDGTRPRGHTSLTGAADAQISVKKSDGGVVTATVEFMKDGADGEAWHSRLGVVSLGFDDDGDEVTTCVVMPADASEIPAPGPNRRKQAFSGAERVALQALEDLLDEGGADIPGDAHVPPGAPAASLEQWKARAIDSGITGSPDKDTKRRTFNRIKNGLAEIGVVGICPKYELVWDKRRTGTAGQFGTNPDIVPDAGRDRIGHTPLRGVPCPASAPASGDELVDLLG